MWYLHIMEYYSALKRKEVLFPLYVTIWMKLEGIFYIKCQLRKEKTAFHVHEVLRIVTVIETESRIVVARS